MNTSEIEQRERTLIENVKSRNNGEYKYSCLTDAEKMEEKELSFRRMINSCLCYGHDYNIKSQGVWGEYGLRYGVEKLGEERANEIWEEQREYFRTHARIIRNAFTDSEGCVYSAIEWR